MRLGARRLEDMRGNPSKPEEDDELDCRLATVRFRTSLTVAWRRFTTQTGITSLDLVRIGPADDAIPYRMARSSMVERLRAGVLVPSGITFLAPNIAELDRSESHPDTSRCTGKC